MKILMIVAHPNLENSVANKRISEKLPKYIKNLEVRNILELNPDYKINVEAEQQALIEADTVIFQYPFYWYNMPAILKLWFDEVFSYNFAYGAEGNKLKGKNFLQSITIGGPAESYTPLGYNHFKIEEFSKPLEQTAYLAQMNYLPPIYEHGLVYIPGVYNTKEIVEERADKQIEKLVNVLTELQIETPEKTIQKFVKQWFGNFDALAEENYFTQYISESTKFSFPEGEFVGSIGFNQWYTNIKKSIKPNNEHIIESLHIKENKNHFDVDLAVKLKAETYTNEKIQLNVKENWKVKIEEEKIKIQEYKVQEV
ncbi:NAD(P)H-dependent oxidoreductase [Tenacibaculum aiptasiae]|uniref:NAD(P)H-dependent oxidoreductase n=1 Tax=Tenacibaculum aiptasiae TaxID=426481 RepID=A0A7J5AG49_9FLAO|nr:NAD(P)H-dependent oxidoreductase [Tenacibaculum aiptasiae]KAB1156463.1 NAD(P)H-dependent oxidoreductase [Tenacibaculum aiptasiae]